MGGPGPATSMAGPYPGMPQDSSQFPGMQGSQPPMGGMMSQGSQPPMMGQNPQAGMLGHQSYPTDQFGQYPGNSMTKMPHNQNMMMPSQQGPFSPPMNPNMGWLTLLIEAYKEDWRGLICLNAESLQALCLDK